MTAQSSPLLSARGLVKRFGGAVALEGADLTIAKGSIHALVGENGAGKSTLIKCLLGVHRPDAGAILLAGEPLALEGPADAERRGLRGIHQELNLVPSFDAIENAFVGRRYPRRGPFIDRAAMRGKVARVAAEIAPDLPLDRPASRLTPGQRQMAEIVRALIEPSQLVIMDEPTSSLGEAEAERLHEAVRKLAQRGCAVLFISHRLNEVMALCDAYTVLRNGRTPGAGAIADIDRAGLVALMTGAPAAAARPYLAAAKGADPVFTADIPFGPSGGRIALSVRPGEIVGLYGLVGAGRSSLLKVLWGARPAKGGRTAIDGRPLVGGPAARIARGIAYVPEDRRREGLAMTLSIADNLGLPHLSSFRRTQALPLPSPAKLRRFARDVAGRLKVAMAAPDRPPAILSGGNQQKLLFGRWFGRPIRLLLVDEPSRGVDVGAKGEIHAEVLTLAAAGAGVLMATSDIEELLALSTRVLVLNAGRLAGEFAAPPFDRNAIVAAAFGGPAAGAAA